MIFIYKMLQSCFIVILTPDMLLESITQQIPLNGRDLCVRHDIYEVIEIEEFILRQAAHQLIIYAVAVRPGAGFTANDAYLLQIFEIGTNRLLVR
ncbi:hypothetical protein D1872_282020 [compost metagenome]